MRKFACNRLYIHNQYLSHAVVTMDERGEVESYFPFSEEMSATEWIGGIIVLSDKEDAIQCTSFQNFRDLMTSAKRMVYAWHISNFDFQQEEFTPQSIIRRL